MTAQGKGDWILALLEKCKEQHPPAKGDIMVRVKVMTVGYRSDAQSIPGEFAIHSRLTVKTSILFCDSFFDHPQAWKYILQFWKEI
jgi:hypothetical protein